MLNLITQRLLNNNLLKNIFNLSILQFLSAFLSLTLIPLLARVLEPTIFGIVMFLHLITNYFIWFTEWGFGQGGTQKISNIRSNSAQLSKCFNQIYTSQIFLIFLSIVPIFMAILFFQVKYKFDNNAIIVMICYFILSSAIPVWFLNGMEKVTHALLTQIYPKILALLSVIFFIKKPEDFLYYFIALNLGLIFSIFHTFYIINKNYKIKLIFSNPYLQLKNNFNYFINSFTKTLGSNIIPFFLEIVTSIEIFGFYVLADKIKGAALIILNPIYQSVFPRMCHVVKQKSYISYLKKYSIFIIFIILIICSFIFILINQIISNYIGPDYQTSSALVKLMIPSIIMSSIISIMLYFILIPFDLNKELMKVSIINFAVILIISYPIISLLNSYGAVLVLTISDFLFIVFYSNIIFKNKLLKN